MSGKRAHPVNGYGCYEVPKLRQSSKSFRISGLLTFSAGKVNDSCVSTVVRIIELVSQAWVVQLGYHLR